MKKILISSLMMVLGALACLGQVSGGGPGGQQPQFDGQRPPHHGNAPKIVPPAEFAKKEADKMRRELNIDDKQYKKIYKLVKQDREYRQAKAEEAFGGFPGSGGPGGFSGGPGAGGPGFGGPGGGFGGPGAGPGPGGQGLGGQRPDGAPQFRPGADLVSDEYLEKLEKKYQKILSPEQYAKWRRKHPAEHHTLPDTL